MTRCVGHPTTRPTGGRRLEPPVIRARCASARAALHTRDDRPAAGGRAADAAAHACRQRPLMTYAHGAPSHGAAPRVPARHPGAAARGPTRAYPALPAGTAPGPDHTTPTQVDLQKMDGGRQ